MFENRPTVTAPLPYIDPSDKTFGYEIWSSQLNGSFQTPGFGEKNFCNETFDNVHFVLQLSLAVMEKAENDAIFNIKIKVQNTEGWFVQYRKGAKYVVYNKTKKSWQDAEKFCNDKNGH